MIRQNKWLENVVAEDSISKVAKIAVLARSQAVLQQLPSAAKDWRESIEHIHQLRVASRRAHAALRLFRVVLPKKETRAIERQFKQIRRSAGEARDLDVLMGMLRERQETAADELRPMFDRLLDSLAKRRKRAQREVRIAWKAAKSSSLKSAVQRLVNDIAWQKKSAEPTLAEAAPRLLQPLSDRFFSAGEGPLQEVDELHQFRIAGKRFRYAIELLASTFTEEARTRLYAVVEETQSKLGEINDRATMLARVRDWLDDHPRLRKHYAMRLFLSAEVSGLAELIEAFRHWWVSERNNLLESQVVGLLSQVSNGLASRIISEE